MIRTERLLLREWRDDDREPWAAMSADPEVMEFFPESLDRRAADAFVDRRVAQFDQLGWGLWAVEAEGQFIGFTGLAVPTYEAHFTPCVEVGWRLARPAWGKGYAIEGARAALNYGFNDLRLDEIVSLTAAGNTRSRAVMERLGMTRNPDDDFDHPALPTDSPLSRHVLYRSRRGP